jgi:hypothetical protein
MAQEPDIQEGRQQSGIPQDQVRFEHYEVDDYKVFGG